MHAAIYQPEDIRRQFPTFLGLFLDVLDDGLPILP
jgi:hypothetical protein